MKPYVKKPRVVKGFSQDVPPVTFRMNADQRRELDADAERLGIPVADLVRQRVFPDTAKKKSSRAA